MLDKLRQWFGLERRSVDYADPALRYLYGDTRTSSGEPVSLERAAGLTAVWACTTLISGTIASMPLVLYKRTADGRECHLEHPLYDVLHIAPVHEAFVAGDDEAGPLVAADQEAEEQAGLLPGQGQVAELVEDEDAGIGELLQGPVEAVLVAGAHEPAHEALGEDDPQERQLAHARLAHGRLQRLVEQVEPWRPTAVDTVARLVQATVIALRRQRVDQLHRELAALKTRRDALAEPDAHDQDAAALLARMVARVGHPLPVATIRWPKSADPFAAPVLEEPA
jgi:hypothetical protein